MLNMRLHVHESINSGPRTKISPIVGYFLVGLLLGISLFPAQAWSDEDTTHYPKFSISVGDYHLSGISTDLLVGTTSGSAAVGVSFENTLNMPTSADVQRLDGYYQYNDRNRIEFSYYELNRIGAVNLGTPIDIAGVPFDGDVASTTEAKMLKAIWSHSYIKDHKYDFGIGAGLYISTSKSTITDVSTPGNSVSGDETTPLPVFSLRGAWNITPKWTFWIKQEVFVLDIQDLSSSLSDFTIALERQLTRSIGVGVNLNYFNVNASTTVGGYPAELNRSYRGAMVYLTIAN